MALAREWLLGGVVAAVLVGIGAGSAYVFLSDDPYEIRTFRRLMPVLSVAFSPDGHTAASGDAGGFVCLWGIHSGTRFSSKRCHDLPVGSVQFGPQGRRILTVAYDGAACVWDVRTWKKLREFKGSRGMAVAFSPDSRHVLMADGNAICVRDVRTGRLVRRLQDHPTRITHLAVARRGNCVVSVDARGNTLLWPGDLRGKPRWLAGQGTRISCLAVSADGRVGAACRKDGTLNVLEFADRSSRGHNHGAAIEALAVSPDGRYVLVGGTGNRYSYGSIRMLLCVQTVRSLQTVVEYWGHDRPVHAVAISFDGRYALSGSADGTMRLWRMPK